MTITKFYSQYFSKPKTLAEALADAVLPTTYTGLPANKAHKPEVYEWDRVQQMRAEKHHLCKGGRSRK